MCKIIKCWIFGHKYKKEASGFDPQYGNFYIAYRCAHCNKLMIERWKDEKFNEDLRLP